ncbi:hypothetical protein DFH07DRAFT_777638 [Mycena maculata]|uniref:Uncharacterized protein n=1 Tax=Mycena maculata TaxID=230809 RepID=A0AAD7N1T7_9AGAR|nr:hypothetical protein DFH07DRAFT_777638 [Mycena maculata]
MACEQLLKKPGFPLFSLWTIFKNCIVLPHVENQINLRFRPSPEVRHSQPKINQSTENSFGAGIYQVLVTSEYQHNGRKTQYSPSMKENQVSSRAAVVVGLPSVNRESAVLRLTVEHPPSPERVPVVRPPDDVPDVKTRAHMWVIPRAKDPSYLPSASSRLLLCQEYYNILVALLWYLDRKREAAPADMKQAFPDPSADDVHMDVDGYPIEQINVLLRQIKLLLDQKYSPGPDKLCIPEHMPDISEATIFPNPFLDPHQGNLYREFGALIITGLPGIGKTVLLAVIFWLHVVANLPTAYMTDPNIVLVYTTTHFFVLHNPTLIPAALERNTWFLVDSNIRNLDPPQAVINSGHFIVQAASPRASRTQWAVKNQGSGIRPFCLMQPWTLDELFTGSSLKIEQRTGVDMHTFFQKFGGSARHVYDESHRLSAFNDLVKEAAATLVNDTELIIRVIQLRAPNRSIDDKAGHMLVTPLPLSDRDRTQFGMASPTSYLEDLLILQLDRNLQTARRLLYVINVGVGTPGCKATAADLLDKHHHWFIGEGGRWRLRKFKKLPHARSGATANLWQAQEECYWVKGHQCTLHPPGIEFFGPNPQLPNQVLNFKNVMSMHNF